MLEKKRVICIDVSTGKYEQFVEEILSLAQRHKDGYVCVANAHMLVEAYNDSDFREVVNNAVITTPDGLPITASIRLLYGIPQQRVAGPDLLPDLLAGAEREGVSVFFYGSTSEVLHLIEQRVRLEHPSLRIAGFYSPPFRDLTLEEKKEIAAMINCSEADIVFVALGCPKQERWMAEMRNKLSAVLVGVGAAFPIYAGIRSRAPRWIQSLCLEWFYRLLQEPRRLLRRYLRTNGKFVYLLFRELLAKMLSGGV